jgi:hypothetical protein
LVFGYRFNDLRSHDVRTILEVGSHVGSFTVIAHHYWPSERIVAVEPFWTQVTDFGIDEVDLIKLDCEGAEYLIISELSVLGLMNRIGWIRSEWHSRKDNLLLANNLGQTHVFNTDPNYPHSVGMFVAHRVIS